MNGKHIYSLLLMLSLHIATVFAEDVVQIVRYDGCEGLLDSEVSCALQDGRGYIWFSTRDGLVRYDGHTFKTYKAWQGDDCPLKVNRISFIGEASNHDILCYSDEKYYRFDIKTDRFTETTDTISDKRHENNYTQVLKEKILTLEQYKGFKPKVRLVDNQGGIWVSSSRGLERVSFERKKISAINTNGGKEEEIKSFMTDRHGRLWVADKNGYVKVYFPNHSQPQYLKSSGFFTTKRTAFGSNVYSMYEDKTGTIWLGSKPDGLFVLRPQGGAYNIKNYKHSDNDKSSLSDNSIYSIVADSRDNIWIGTNGGGLNLVLHNGYNNFKFVNMNNAIKLHPKEAMYIHGMDITRDDILLLATDKGFFTCNTKQRVSAMKFYGNFRRLNDKTSLGQNVINDVVCDKYNNVWLATSGAGISVARPQNLLSDKIRFESFNTRSGLATDMFLSLVIDNSNRVWGVGKLSLAEIDVRSGKIVNHKSGCFEEGLHFSEANPLCMEDGTIMIGCQTGFISFSPAMLQKSDYVPKIIFDNHNKVELQPGEKNVRIEFAALDFEQNEDIIYKYKLEGVDDDWHYTNDNWVDYTNFPIGEYRLHVASTNSDGIWVDNEAVITITRHAAFHEMWYSWMLYGVLVCLFAIVVYRVVRYIMRLKREMFLHKQETDARVDNLVNKVKELMEVKTEVNNDDVDTDNYDETFSERAKNYIIDNISDADISVGDFARHMGISPSLLYIKCKKKLGYTPNNYILNVRIKYAMKLIEQEPDINISSVAYKCGFSDPKYFSRCFKKITGYNPSEYKQK